MTSDTQSGASRPVFISTLVSLLLLIGAATTTQAQSTAQSTQDEDRIAHSCQACRLASQSVEELIRRPRQMDPYGQMSERIDLDKIKKTVCKDIASDRDRERCRSFFYSHLDTIERWRHQQGKVSFHDFVCIREMKLCCPSGSYGPKCTKCAKCATSNEHCHGEATRAGNGTCVCKPGHSGRNCATCLGGYYQDKRALEAPELSDKRLLCKPCHRSCQYCRAPGPDGCEVCAKGFAWIAGFGCSDVDECIQSDNKICGTNTFCVNTVGSYFCYECDRACNGCHGDGPDMCLRCAKNYRLENGNCVAQQKTILPPEANYYRYAIYVGLCVCTCIILHNSVYLASLVGLGVALYIGASEYVMSGHPGLAARAGLDASNNPFAGLSANPSLSLPNLDL